MQVARLALDNDKNICVFSFFLRFIYLFIHDREKEKERERGRHRQREKQAPCQEPDGTRSRDSRITPWAKGRRKTAEPPRNPQ